MCGLVSVYQTAANGVKQYLSQATSTATKYELMNNFKWTIITLMKHLIVNILTSLRKEVYLNVKTTRAFNSFRSNDRRKPGKAATRFASQTVPNHLSICAQSKVIKPTTRQKQHYWAIYVRYNLASVAIGRTEVCWVFTRTLTRPRILTPRHCRDRCRERKKRARAKRIAGRYRESAKRIAGRYRERPRRAGGRPRRALLCSWRTAAAPTVALS